MKPTTDAKQPQLPDQVAPDIDGSLLLHLVYRVCAEEGPPVDFYKPADLRRSFLWRRPPGGGGQRFIPTADQSR